MHTTLYLTASLDGFIAYEDDSAPWGAEVLQNYFNVCNSYDNIILGRRTFDLMLADNSSSGLRVKFKVVVSKHASQQRLPEQCFARSPQEALDLLAAQGFSRALVIGGQKLALSFFREGLVDEFLIDLHPSIIGKGIPIFGEQLAKRTMAYCGHEEIGSDLLRLRYTIKNVVI